MVAETLGLSASRSAFGLADWTVEPQLNRITKGEISVHLEPRAMEALLCLCDHPGQVVPRQVLVDTVWSTEFITDSTLTHTIGDLRRALADDARAPRFIETIPKRGYRLVAEVAADGAADAPQVHRSVNRKRPLAVIIGERVRVDHRFPSDPSDHFLFLGDNEIPLTGGAITFGRGPEADIQILVPEVSRCHARMAIDPDAVVIKDLGSKNGTLVNDDAIDHPCELNSGDTIRIGPTTLVFHTLVTDPTKTQQDH